MALAATPKFPAAIATETDMLNHKNKVPSVASPTLSAGITSGATSISLSTGTGSALPTDNFVISIDDEIILIASRSTDTLTVATGGRGYEGSTAAAHSSGATVEARITALAHNQLAAEVNALENNVKNTTFIQIGVNRNGTWVLGSANSIRLRGFVLTQPITASHIMFWVSTLDATNLYSLGIYDSSGNLVCTTSAVSLPATGFKDLALTSTVTLAAGKYYLAYTGNATTAVIAVSQASGFTFCGNVGAVQNSSAGVLPSTVTPPADTWDGGVDQPFFALR